MSVSFKKCTCALCVGLVSASLAGGFSAEDCPQHVALCRSLPPDQAHGHHEDQRPSPPKWIRTVAVSTATTTTSTAGIDPQARERL
jgi:hypothetical protein